MSKAAWKLCGFSLLITAGLLAPNMRAIANPSLYKRCLRSTAWVVMPKSFGSATLVNERERILLTNYHVVGDEGIPIVFFPTYKANYLITSPDHYIKNAGALGIKGKVIARLKSSDLALIQLESVPRGIVELPLAERSPSPGETLFSVGNSGVKNGSLWRFSKGEVRQVFVARFKTGAGNPPSNTFEINAKVVETQIPVNPGDSGGPVMNNRGELTAVTQGYQPDQRLVTSMIDISEVRALLKKEKLLPTKQKKPGA